MHCRPSGRIRAALIDEVDRAGLRGHGGASFPVSKKMRSVAARRGAKVVVVNGTEGEPASNKDRALLREAPHLVLDGAALAARAIGANDVFLAFSERDHPQLHSLTAALEEAARPRGAERPVVRRARTVPRRAGNGAGEHAQRRALPADVRHRPYERGVHGRPTLVQNAETLAHLALIARNGADWFRQLGPRRDPGSALITISGAGARRGSTRSKWNAADTAAGYAGAQQPLAAVLIGGYFGNWLPAAEISAIRLSPGYLRERGASPERV